ncbi:MAG: hypothetical protein KY468_12050 [Armatimonadetes bacterium]|nr:hypothetical protein [Armatimonadota bacterium]
MIEASSPGRAGIVGNPTDMYGGNVLSTSLSERATATLRPADSLQVESSGVHGVIASKEDLQPTGDYLDIIKAVLTHFWEDLPHRNFALACRTEVPASSGLAGSTALCAALTGAILRFIGRELPPHWVAEECRIIEREVMGVQCGFQDQYMTIFGGRNYIDTRGKERLQGAATGEPLATVEPLAHLSPDPPFLLASTGVERHSGQAHTPIRQRWEEGDPAVIEGYERVIELGRMGKKALLAGNWDALGSYMNENHAIHAGFGGSHPACDHLIQAARDSGAYGAKLAGAGAGGTIIALCKDSEKTEAALRDAGAFRILVPKPGPGLQVTGEIQ